MPYRRVDSHKDNSHQHWKGQSRGQSVANDEMERERNEVRQKYIQIPPSLPNSYVILSKLSHLSGFQSPHLKQGKITCLLARNDQHAGQSNT